jgi:hypothetical protein
MNAMISVIAVPPPQTWVGYSKCAAFNSLVPTVATHVCALRYETLRGG